MPELIYAEMPVGRRVLLTSWENAADELEKLRRSGRIVLSPGWDLPHTLDHCAQSIEYAMSGFPHLRHPLFRALAGKAAFHIFNLRGYMQHDLGADIPGSVLPAHPPTLEKAFDRLQETMLCFENHRGPLMPHFAYGSLSKKQYERANILHIANHLSALEY